MSCRGLLRRSRARSSSHWRMGTRCRSSHHVPDRQQQHQGGAALPCDEAHRREQARGVCLVRLCVCLFAYSFSLSAETDSPSCETAAHEDRTTESRKHLFYECCSPGLPFSLSSLQQCLLHVPEFVAAFSSLPPEFNVSCSRFSSMFHL